MREALSGVTSKKRKVHSWPGGRDNDQKRGIAAQLNRLATNKITIHTVDALVK